MTLWTANTDRWFWFRIHCFVNSIAHKFSPARLKPNNYNWAIYEYDDNWLWRLNKYCANKWLKYYSLTGESDGKMEKHYKNV